MEVRGETVSGGKGGWGTEQQGVRVCEEAQREDGKHKRRAEEELTGQRSCESKATCV